jgi:hypothetical protein
MIMIMVLGGTGIGAHGRAHLLEYIVVPSSGQPAVAEVDEAIPIGTWFNPRRAARVAARLDYPHR